MIITGYLNCNCLNNTLQQMGRMEEFLMANVLTQLITEPTRVTSSTCSLKIEVLITSTPDSFKLAGVLSTSFSDHLPIFGVLNVPTVRPTEH